MLDCPRKAFTVRVQPQKLMANTKWSTIRQREREAGRAAEREQCWSVPHLATIKKSNLAREGNKKRGIKRQGGTESEADWDNWHEAGRQAAWQELPVAFCSIYYWQSAHSPAELLILPLSPSPLAAPAPPPCFYFNPAFQSNANVQLNCWRRLSPSSFAANQNCTIIRHGFDFPTTPCPIPVTSPRLPPPLPLGYPSSLICYQLSVTSRCQ